MKGAKPSPAVLDLLEAARSKGVNAYAVPIETFDSMMTRIWRNILGKTPELDAKVRRTSAAMVSIPLHGAGTAAPLVRMNALPILSVPQTCLELTFATPKQWADLRQVQHDKELKAIFTKTDSVWCWGVEADLRAAFGSDLVSVGQRDVPADLSAPGNLHVQGFLEEALCVALTRERPLLSRKVRNGALLIVDPQATDVGALDPLFKIVGKCSGNVEGVIAPVTAEHPNPVKVTWAESCRVSLDYKEGRLWAQIDPDVWIWPPRARESAVKFLDARRGNRYNKLYNQLLNAWIEIIFASDERNIEIEVSALDFGGDSANPKFRLSSRTAFARRLAA